MLQTTIQANMEKDKLLRGSMETIDSINTKIEKTGKVIQETIGLQVKPQYFPVQLGPEYVHERLKIFD